MVSVVKFFQHVSRLGIVIAVLALLMSGCGDGSSNSPTASNSSALLPANAFLSETLKDGQTVGIISEGSLTSEGLQLSGGNGFIRYGIPTTPYGYAEFSMKGFIMNEIHGGSEFKGVIFTMWSADDGYSYENAPFVFELRKYGHIDGRPDASNCILFKIKSNGIWEETHFHVMSWDPNATYRFRVEWGGGQASVLRDGQLVMSGTYHAEFNPSNHHVQFGAQPLRQKQSPHNLLISDIVIGTL